MDLFFIAIRYTINGIAIFYILKNENLKTLKLKEKIHQMAPFILLLNTFILISYSLTMNFCILQILFLVISTLYFAIKNKNDEKFESTFLSLLSLHIILFIAHSIAVATSALIYAFVPSLDIINTHFINELIILTIYYISIFIILKYKFIKISLIKKLINYIYVKIMLFIIWSFFIFTTYLTSINQTRKLGNLGITILILTFAVIVSFIGCLLPLLNKLYESSIKTKIENEKYNIIKKCEESSEIESFKNDYLDDWNLFSSILSSFNIDVKLKGHNQLLLSLILIKNSSIKNPNFTGVVYPNIAKLTNSTTKSVSRNIETAITSAWDRTDPEIMDSKYNYYINPNKGTPTNKEFIMYILKHANNK